MKTLGLLPSIMSSYMMVLMLGTDCKSQMEETRKATYGPTYTLNSSHEGYTVTNRTSEQTRTWEFCLENSIPKCIINLDQDCST